MHWKTGLTNETPYKDDVFQWAIENRAEFAEARFEDERQWSRAPG